MVGVSLGFVDEVRSQVTSTYHPGWMASGRASTHPPTNTDALKLGVQTESFVELKP